MSDTPTRYTARLGGMEESEHGGYVEYADYKAETELRERELAALRAELETTKAARDGWKASFGHENARYQQACHACDHYIASNRALLDALQPVCHRLEWAIQFLAADGDIEKMQWYDAKEWLPVAREQLEFALTAIATATRAKEDV